MIEKRIDSLFSDWNTSSTPGCAVGILSGGQLMYSKGYGIRDIDNPTPIDEDTCFDIGSEAKQFTGASILLLARDNAVDLDADVHDYVPELPDYGYKVTLDHLAHHTSGLPEFYDEMMNAGLFKKQCTIETVLNFLKTKRKLDNVPGDRFIYSNSGYVLLALVIERTSGMSFAQFVDRHLFQPIGMSASFVSDIPQFNRHDMARGHDISAGAEYRHSEFLNYAVPGPGSLYSTVRDLSRWICAIENIRSVLSSIVKQMLSPGILNSGECTRYGFGLDWGQCFTPPNGLNIITHAGSHAGFRSVILRLPDHDLAVILLCNTRNIDHCKIALAVADIILDRKTPSH